VTGIASVFGTQHLELGLNDTGSRSVGEVHESIFRRSIVSTLQNVADSFEIMFKSIMRYNFGEGAESFAPRLTFSGLNVSPLQQVLPMIPQLSQIDGLLDDELMGSIRAMLHELVSVQGRRR